MNKRNLILKFRFYRLACANVAAVLQQSGLTQRECNCKDQNTKQRNPIIVAWHIAALFIMTIRSKAGESKRHKNAAGDEQRNSSDRID